MKVAVVSVEDGGWPRDTALTRSGGGRSLLDSPVVENRSTTSGALLWVVLLGAKVAVLAS